MGTADSPTCYGRVCDGLRTGPGAWLFVLLVLWRRASSRAAATFFSLSLFLSIYAPRQRCRPQVAVAKRCAVLKGQVIFIFPSPLCILDIGTRPPTGPSPSRKVGEGMHRKSQIRHVPYTTKFTFNNEGTT
jgi:hypothetical protein